MKGYLTAIVWMVFWIYTLTSLSSCINIPPPSPMGDGAFQQLGLINIAPHSRDSAVPQAPPRPVVSITDNGVAITYPKN